jgi:adenosylcobinamide kinase/adenosylcobinamide-phosphate guanylyltransferase
MALTLVIGGVRSGKSRLAEKLAAASPPVTYVATAQARDAEMARRIALHRQRRLAEWKTVEEPWKVVGAVCHAFAAQGRPTELANTCKGRESMPRGIPGSVLLECLPLWLTNLLLGLPGYAAMTEAEILSEVDALIQVADTAPGQLIVVSNEVGCGVMPANELARRFGDLLGEANQRLAAGANEVHGCVAGISMRLK